MFTEFHVYLNQKMCNFKERSYTGVASLTSLSSPSLHTHSHAHTHALTRAHTRTHTHTHTHTHRHTHADPCAQKESDPLTIPQRKKDGGGDRGIKIERYEANES